MKKIILIILFVAELSSWATITDKGEIEAYSYIIECHEIWKNRIYGFLFGVATSVTALFIKWIATCLLPLIIK